MKRLLPFIVVAAIVFTLAACGGHKARYTIGVSQCSSDIWRMAEAMTRHCSEVDTYHIGRLAPLGSRHNVTHWGCGAKEARISQAAFDRFY